jgi:hypothetical protein
MQAAYRPGVSQVYLTYEEKSDREIRDELQRVCLIYNLEKRADGN